MAEYSNLKQAVEAYQAGDNDAFRYIYDETNSSLYVYAKYIMKDESRAEELLQDTYLEIIKSIGNLKDPDAFTTWSKQIMFNLSRHAFEKSSREQQNTISRGDDNEEIQIADLDRDYTPEERADANFVNRVVRDAIDRLPAEMSFVLVSHYMDGLKIREIAEITGDPENTIKSRLRLGRNKVKEMLEKYEKETDTKLLTAAPASLIATALRSIGADPSFMLPEGAGSTIFAHLAKALSDAATAAGAAGSAGTGGAAGASGASGAAGTAGTAGSGAGPAATAGEAAGTSAAKAAAGAAAAKAAKGGLAKKITALVIAACVGVGGGAAVIHHQRAEDAAETDKLAEEQDKARSTYADYFEDYLQPAMDENGNWDSENDIKYIFSADKDKDKIPDLFIYYPEDKEYSDEGSVADYEDLRMCLYAKGKMHEFAVTDVLNTVSMESEYMVYMSKDRKHVSLVGCSLLTESDQNGEYAGMTTYYFGKKYVLKGNKYKETDSADDVKKNGEGFDDFKKTFMPDGYYKYEPFKENGSGNEMYDVSDLDSANYLARYGINILRIDEDTDNWKKAYRKFFADEKKYSYGLKGKMSYASDKIAVEDINGDGIPEVFAANESGGDPTSPRLLAFTFADGKIVCFGHDIASQSDGIWKTGKNELLVGGSYLPFLNLYDATVADMPYRMYKLRIVDSGFMVTEMLQSSSGTNSGGDPLMQAEKNWKSAADDSGSEEIEAEMSDLAQDETDDNRLSWSKGLKEGEIYKYIKKQIEKF